MEKENWNTNPRGEGKLKTKERYCQEKLREEKLKQKTKKRSTKINRHRLCTQTILCHIYHHSIQNNWYEARDLMLMSHLQDTISHSVPITQILYNHTN